MQTQRQPNHVFTTPDGYKIVKSEITINVDRKKPVSVTKAGNVVEIVSMAKQNNAITIKKVNDSQYVDLITGELKDFKKKEKRIDDTAYLRQTFKKLRALINNNFLGQANELHIVLTYAENMTDNVKLSKDLELFIKKIRYKYGSDIEYITVIEPQARGAWHAHVLLRFDNMTKVFIPNKTIAEMWGHGFTKTKLLFGVDNIGAYLSAYLSNVYVTDITEKPPDVCDTSSGYNKIVTKKKNEIKGSRLYMYPSGINIYRTSQGIAKPLKFNDTYGNVKMRLQDVQRTYAVETKIYNPDGTLVNTLIHEYYNLKRKQKQPLNDNVLNPDDNKTDSIKNITININL